MKISEKIVVGLDKNDLSVIVASYLKGQGYSCRPEDVCFQVGVGCEAGKGSVGIFEGCEVSVFRGNERNAGAEKVNEDDFHNYMERFQNPLESWFSLL